MGIRLKTIHSSILDNASSLPAEIYLTSMISIIRLKRLRSLSISIVLEQWIKCYVLFMHHHINACATQISLHKPETSDRLCHNLMPKKWEEIRSNRKTSMKFSKQIWINQLYSNKRKFHKSQSFPSLKIYIMIKDLSKRSCKSFITALLTPFCFQGVVPPFH